MRYQKVSKKVLKVFEKTRNEHDHQSEKKQINGAPPLVYAWTTTPPRPPPYQASVPTCKNAVLRTSKEEQIIVFVLLAVKCSTGMCDNAGASALYEEEVVVKFNY